MAELDKNTRIAANIAPLTRARHVAMALYAPFNEVGMTTYNIATGNYFPEESHDSFLLDAPAEVGGIATAAGAALATYAATAPIVGEQPAIALAVLSSGVGFQVGKAATKVAAVAAFRTAAIVAAAPISLANGIRKMAGMLEDSVTLSRPQLEALYPAYRYRFNEGPKF